jgi:hypothetical protein
MLISSCEHARRERPCRSACSSTESRRATHTGSTSTSGHGTVIEPRLYQLVRQRDEIAERTLEIEFGLGVEAYVYFRLSLLGGQGGTQERVALPNNLSVRGETHEMSAQADSLLTVRWRDRSFVLRAPEQVEELARRLRQKGLANIAVSIVEAVVKGETDYEKALSDEEREAVYSVLTETESDPALRRAFNLLCAQPES